MTDSCMIDNTSSPLSPAAERACLARERRRRGLIVVPVEIFREEVGERVRQGRLDPSDADDRWKIGRAVSQVLETWIARSSR